MLNGSLTYNKQMLNLLYDDVLLHITKFLFPRDIISIKLLNRYFSKKIFFSGKIDDNTQNITHITEKISNRIRCIECGVIFYSIFELELHILDYHKNYENTITEIKLSNFNDLISSFTRRIRNIVSLQLLSINDIDCVKNNCNCMSKNFLKCTYSDMVRILTPVGHKIYFKYKLFTNYGIVDMDTEFYTKQNILFTDYIYYYPSTSNNKYNKWKNDNDIKKPRILQTKYHHWIILHNYSRHIKIIPILRIEKIF